MGWRPPIVPALHRGLRSWEEFVAGGQLGLVEELALGYDGPCLDRGTVRLRVPHLPSVEGCCPPPRHCS